MLARGGLQLISSYSSSSEDEDETVIRKRGELSNEPEQQPSTKKILPIPKGVLDMFGDADLSPEQTEHHEGRVRSFSHFPGNWSAHVYIPVDACNKFEQVVESLVAYLPSTVAPLIHVLASPELHISLSRTVPIRHYWIEPLVEQLRSKTASHCGFSCSLHCPEWYVNDDKTRSFLGLKISSGEKQLKSLVDVVDSIFGEFALPQFYKDPSFHVSVAWCLGDVHTVISGKNKDMFAACVSEQLDRSSLLVVKVSQVLCKIGNKTFSFPLRLQRS